MAYRAYTSEATAFGRVAMTDEVYSITHDDIDTRVQGWRGVAFDVGAYRPKQPLSPMVRHNVLNVFELRSAT